MNDVSVKDKAVIEKLIYEIRGVQVILDSDLAMLYECVNGTKDINKAVKRNIERFPESFMFQLTNEEYDNLRFQSGTSKVRGGRRYNPYVFTEQGVAMLSSVLHSEIAVKMSIQIINTFVIMRKYISNNLIEQSYINNLVLEHDSEIKLLKESFGKIEEKKKINEIYFNGQIYDAYSKIQDIFKSATNRLIIIDAYADNTLLDIIKRLNIQVIIITKKDNLLTNQDITKYNKQYHNLKVVFNNNFHDRYFLIDDKSVYHCGTSINRIGYKTFSINLISDEDVCNSLINKVNKII
ncbi:MAG: ORF6N domain-containing protein [Bacilli bacterium]|nr:ORF6N domain-containing protein [Bacilli bacterium]